ncbi:MAG: DNA starvation/stationary phase protection protein [Pseudomonadota bacterium]
MNLTATTLATDARAEIVEALNQSIAETVVTTMMAQNFHWNVTGMAFGPLHDLFQEIYEDHFEAQDDLAERIKALGGHADGVLADMVARSKVSEHHGRANARQMIETLLTAQDTLATTLAGAGDLAASHGDKLTEDLMISRGQAHEKLAWKLRAHLD